MKKDVHSKGRRSCRGIVMVDSPTAMLGVDHMKSGQPDQPILFIFCLGYATAHAKMQ